MANNGEGMKAFGGVVAIVAVVAGIYAMVEPMNQRIDYLSAELDSIRDKMTADEMREREDNLRNKRT